MDETVEKVSLTSWVDRRERDKLIELAIAGDRTLSAEVRRAVARHVEREHLLSGETRRSSVPPEAAA